MVGSEAVCSFNGALFDRYFFLVLVAVTSIKLGQHYIFNNFKNVLHSTVETLSLTVTPADNACPGEDMTFTCQKMSNDGTAVSNIQETESRSFHNLH